MLIVHHLGISQSERIVWLCEELGIDYTLKVHDRHPETSLAQDDYRALHPLGTAPIIQDIDEQGRDLALAESGAIVDYIIHKHGGGRLSVAPDAPNYANYLFWFHFANGSLMPARMIDMVLGMLGIEGAKAEGGPAEMMKARGARVYDLVDSRLGVSDYLAGDELTAADIMSVFPLTTMRLFAPLDFSGHPNIRAWLKRIGARPAYQRAMEKGDPGMELLLD